ncbi:MAG TPA: hypothetical protein PLW65_13395 [Pseudomonadota bacterium]|nr:hypothetical protein [Pseudomonadota bacterium]
MKSQLQNHEILSSALPSAQPGAETSRIAAAISRILLVHRATGGSAAHGSLPAEPEPESESESIDRRRDATPVEWALRMMF